MTDILADYFDWRDEQEDRIGTHGDRCHMWPRHERCMIHRLARALEAARLTAEERQAIAWVCGDVADITGPTEATLRGTAGADGVTKRRTERNKSRQFLQIK
jgi:hypothetical protein